MTDPGISDNDRLGHYVALWKQAVEVQMHFNDLEWRIRGLALTALTFALGAAALVAKDGTTIGWASVGSLLLLPSLVLWGAFYYVDRFWYHPLLKGAGKEAEALEASIRGFLPDVQGLSNSITAASPHDRSWVVRKIRPHAEKVHSDGKLKQFYALGAIAILLLAVALQLATSLSDPNESPPDEPPRMVPASVSAMASMVIATIPWCCAPPLFGKAPVQSGETSGSCFGRWR